MPVGFHIASAWVDIRAEDKGLRTQVRGIVERAAKGQKIQIPVSISSRGLRDELTRAVRTATRGQGIAVPVKIDSKGLRAELNRAVKEAAGGQGVRIPLHIDSNGLRSEVNRALRVATSGQAPKIHIGIATTGLRSEVSRALTAATAGQKPTVKLGINSAGLRGEVSRAVALAAAGQRVNVPVHVDSRQAESALSRVSSMARSSGSSMSRWKMITMGAFMAVNPAAALTYQVFSKTSAASGSLVAALAGLVTVGATLAVGMNGVGAAVEASAKSEAKFQKALKKLTPSAQQFVKAIVGAKGAYKGLQRAVQQTLFNKLGGEFRQMAKATIPSLTVGLGGMAMSLNKMTRGVMNTITQLARMGTLKTMFGGLHLAMKPLEHMPGQILNGLVKLTIAGTPLLIRMTKAAGHFGDTMNAKVNRLFASGQLQASISRAGDNIVNFFHRIATNPQWIQFIHNMKQAGPQVGHAVATISEALLKLINALAPISGAALKVATALADLINALPVGFISQVMKLVLAFMAFRKVVGVIVGVTAAVRGFATVLGMLRAGSIGVGTAAMMMSGRTRAAAGSLGALGGMARGAGGGLTVLGRGSRGAAGHMGAAGSAAGRTGGLFGRLGGTTGRLSGRFGAMGARVAGSRVGMLAAAGGSRALGMALGPVGIAATVATVGVGLLNGAMTKAPPDIEKVSNTLVRFARTGRIAGPGATVLGKHMNELGAAIGRVAHPGVGARLGDISLKIATFGSNAAGLENAKNKLKSVDAALAGLVNSGHARVAKINFDAMAAAAARNGTSLNKLKTLFPQYQKALQQAKMAQKLAAMQMGLFGNEAVKVQAKLQRQSFAAKGLAQSIGALNNVHRSAMSAELGFKASIDQARQAVQQNGKTLNTNTAAGRANKQALLQLGAQTDSYAVKLKQNGASWSKVNGVYKQGRANLVKVGMQMGLTSGQAKKLAGQILKIPNKKVIVRGEITDITKKLNSAQHHLNGLKQKRKTAVGADKRDLDNKVNAAQHHVNSLKQKRKTLLDAYVKPISDKINKAQKHVHSLRQKRKTAMDGDKKPIDNKIDRAQKHIHSLKQRRKARIDAIIGPLEHKTKGAQKKLDGLHQKHKPKIGVNDKASSAIGHIQKSLNGLPGNKTINITVRKHTEKHALGGIIGNRNATFAAGGLARFATGGSSALPNSGGHLTGPGTGTSDSILARLSNGEFVMRAASVAKYGQPLMDMLNQGDKTLPEIMKAILGGKLPAKTIPGKAAGGAMNKTTSTIGGGSSMGTSSTGGGGAVSTGGGGASGAISAPSGGGTGSAPSGGGTGGGGSYVAASPVNLASSGGTVSGSTKGADPSVSQTANPGGSAQLTATDQTRPAITSAMNNFAAFKTIVMATYKDINANSSTFATQLNTQFTGITMASNMMWNQWRTGMMGATTQTYTAVGGQTTAFGTQQSMKLAAASNSSKMAWAGMGTGMRTTTALAYNAIKGATNAFGVYHVGRLNAARNSSLSTWSGFETGMRGRTTATYNGVKSSVKALGSSTTSTLSSARNNSLGSWSSFEKGMRSRSSATQAGVKASINAMGKGVTNEIAATRTGSHHSWDSFKGGMVSRTNATYRSIKGATDHWGRSTVDMFNHTKNNVGNAWNGVRPKLAAPIKYLINKVINAGVVPAMNTVVKQLGGSSVLKRVSSGGFATGGFVSGPGGPTSDSIPARLSNGEYVMKASSVRKYGVGHMAAINAGRAPVQRAMGGPVGFAKGGLAKVSSIGKDKLEAMLGDYTTKDFEKLNDWIWNSAIVPLLEEAPGGQGFQHLKVNAAKIMRKQSAGYLEASIPNPNMGGANIEAAKKWAKSQAGKPYQWGGAGNPSWDCSGFMSGIQKVIQGKNPKGRLWSTFNFQGSHTPAGWKYHLKSPFQIGITNKGKGHTAGTLGGMNVESSGGAGVHVGKSARGYNSGLFGNNWYGFEPAIGGLSGYKPGAGVKQWTGAVTQSLKEAGKSLQWIPNVLHQMQTESGGNPRAVNLTDSNARAGHPSVGLMQVIKSTFRAYAGKHIKDQPQMYGVSVSPVANIFSAIKYVMGRYGRMSRFNGTPYAMGGHVSGPGGARSDSIPARLSNGEFVMNAQAVRKHGVGFMNRLNQGGMPCYASGGSVGGSSYKVQKGDTLWGLARRFNSTVDELVKLNNIANKNLIYIGDTLYTSSKGGFDYQIKWGDTLSELAVQFHTSVAELMKLNKNIVDPNKIYAGRMLHVPGTGPGGNTPTVDPHANQAYIQGVGWFDIPTFKKVPGVADLPTTNLHTKADENSSKARADLIGQVTLGKMSQFAGGINPEIAFSLGKPESQSALIDTLYSLQGMIEGAKFDAGDEKWLMNKLDVSGVQLLKNRTALDGVNAALEAAQTNLDTLTQSFDQLKESVSQSIVSFGNITKIGKWGTNPNVLINQLMSDVNQATQFSSQLEQLKAKGLNGTMISDIATAGLSGGGMATAASLLLATPEQIAQINALQTQLVTQANRAGDSVAKSMYQSGIDAAQGLVDGLASQKKQIEDLMWTIAKGMELAIKQSLGIASPSKVMHRLGVFTTQGFVGGMDSQIRNVVGASGRVVKASLQGPRMAGTGIRTGSVPADIGNASAGVVINNLNISVEGKMDLTKPTDRRAIATSLVTEIKEAIRRDDKSRR